MWPSLQVGFSDLAQQVGPGGCYDSPQGGSLGLGWAGWQDVNPLTNFEKPWVLLVYIIIRSGDVVDYLGIYVCNRGFHLTSVVFPRPISTKIATLTQMDHAHYC